MRKILINCINHTRQAFSRNVQRRIADLPGVLRLFEKLSSGEQMEIATPEGYSLVINPLFHSNLADAHDLNDYEPDIRKLIMKFTRPGMVAYDIGANVGVFSVLFASIVGEDGIVYAFEPEENNLSCLLKSMERNNLKNIILDRRAVSKTCSTEKFDRRGGAFSGRLVGNGLYNTTGNIRTVETVSIDHVVGKEGYRVPGIMKIDVEGNEGMVLEGMKDTLANYGPMIICEIHTHLGESRDQVINLLTQNGYAVFNINDALALNVHDEPASINPVQRHVFAIKQTKHV